MCFLRIYSLEGGEVDGVDFSLDFSPFAPLVISGFQNFQGYVCAFFGGLSFC